MAEKKPLLDVIIGLISREIGASLRAKDEGVLVVRAHRIRCWLECLEGAQLTESEACQVYGTLHAVAISAREGGLEVVSSLDKMLAALVSEHHLPVASV